MRCSEFRDLHCSFIDDTLAGVELVRMQRHIAECPPCAAHDAKVRRSLMVLRSLPPIEPSPDFGARLDRRLRECQGETPCPAVSFRTVASIGLVASAAMLMYMGESLRVATPQERAQDIVFPPVVAMATPPAPVALGAQTQHDAAAAEPAADTSSNTAGVIVASVGAGVPVWPVAALIEQPSVQLVNYVQAR